MSTISKVVRLPVTVNRILTRGQHKSSAVEETIKVPWGHISGKLWGGRYSGQPVLALHGLFDNAASFDLLAPLLDLGRPVLALDIPGFGQSSNPPPGLSPNYLEILLWLRYLIKIQFKWDKVSMIGHSFGSSLSFSYSAMFPDEVDTYVSIDCSRVHMAIKPQYLMDDLRRGYTGGMLKNSGILREGSYKDFSTDMFEARKNTFPLSKELCEILLPRDLKKTGEDHYQSLVDPRIHLKYIGRPSGPFLDALSKRIKCNVLAIKASKGIFKDKRLEIYEGQIRNMKENCSRLVYVTINGGHHVHMDNPEDVATTINNFFR